MNINNIDKIIQSGEIYNEHKIEYEAFPIVKFETTVKQYFLVELPYNYYLYLYNNDQMFILHGKINYQLKEH